MQKKLNKTAFIKYTLSLMLFGLNGIVASNISLSSYEIVFLRTLIGSIFLLILFVASGGKIHIKENKKDTLFIALSGIAMGASWMFLYEGYHQLGVSIATLLYCSGPVIVMFLSPLFFKERLPLLRIIGFIVVVCGIFLVNGKISGPDSVNKWGIFCGIMSGVAYFVMVTFNKYAKKITGIENAVIQLIFGFLTVGAFVGIKQGFMINISLPELPWILILGIINTGLGCFLYFPSLSRLPVQTVAIFGYLELLFAVLFSAILLGEYLSCLQIVGAVLILGGAICGELIKTD